MLAQAVKIEPGLEYVQDRIYERFSEIITDEEMNALKHKFKDVTYSRDKNLATYVTEIVKYTKSLKGNDTLEEIHFIQTMARDKKTGVVTTQIVYVDKYHNEKNIESIIAKEFDKYVPEFIRPNKEKADKSEIEILSVSNITGLYDTKKISKNKQILKKEDIINHLEYQIESRIKTSERELKKFIDWLCGLRSIGDYPYDGIALRVIISDEKRACGTNGEQLYNFVSHVEKKYGKYGEFLKQNTKTKSENAKKIDPEGNPNVKKLDKDEYDYNNFMDILLNMRKTYLSLKREVKRHPDYKLSKEEKETLKQYFQIKHYLEDGDRAEIQIMTKEMYSHFVGEFIGHTARYIKGRDDDCIEYRLDPAKSDAAKETIKRVNRTIRNKNKPIKLKHLNNVLDDADDDFSDDIIEKLNVVSFPSILLLTNKLENKYRRAVVPWLGKAYLNIGIIQKSIHYQEEIISTYSQ